MRRIAAIKAGFTKLSNAINAYQWGHRLRKIRQSLAPFLAPRAADPTISIRPHVRNKHRSLEHLVGMWRVQGFGFEHKCVRTGLFRTASLCTLILYHCIQDKCSHYSALPFNMFGRCHVKAPPEDWAGRAALHPDWPCCTSCGIDEGEAGRAALHSDWPCCTS